MQTALHLRSRVLPGKRIEVATPELTEGEAVDVIIVPAGAAVTEPMRRAFLRLPIEERRRILAEQAAAMHSHYERESEWRDLQDGDIVDY